MRDNPEHLFLQSLIILVTCVVSMLSVVRLVLHQPTLPYLINARGRLLFSEKISRVDALIRWWALIHFLAKFRVDVYSNVDAY